MAALTTPSAKAYHGAVALTGATGVATLLADLSKGNGVAETGWTVIIHNADPDTGDDVVVGFTATVDTTDGLPVSNFADDPANRRLVLTNLPPHTKVYVNCTNGETRDVRYLAFPTYI